MIQERAGSVMIEPGSVELNTSSRLIDRTDILAICGSLVEEFKDWDELPKVRLSHYTVQASINDQYPRFAH